MKVFLPANVEEDVGVYLISWVGRERSVGLVRLCLFQSFQGFVPGRRATLVSVKVAKPIDAPSGLIGGKDANL